MSLLVILTRKRRLAGLLLSFGCLVTLKFLWPFLNVPSVGLQCMIVVFPDHTHLRFGSKCFKKHTKTIDGRMYTVSGTSTCHKT